MNTLYLCGEKTYLSNLGEVPAIKDISFEINKEDFIAIVGPSGCGKSTIIRNICIERGIEFIDVRLAQMEPCDIKGLPVPNKEEKTISINEINININVNCNIYCILSI